MLEKIAPVGDWILKYIAALDEQCAGFAGHYLRASNERRQVMACFIARKRRHFLDINFCAAAAADHLMSLGHREILLSAFDTVPGGLRGALRRAGSACHEPRFYSLLHRMLEKPDHAQTVRTIHESLSINLNRLRIIRRLPPQVCFQGVVEALSDAGEAKDLASIVELLIDHGVNSNALTVAFQKVTSDRALRETIRRWSLKITLPANPVPQSEEYRPLSTAMQLKSLGRLYRNCAEHYLGGVLDGTDAFAIFKLNEQKRGLIVHLRKRESIWTVEGYFGPGNARPSSRLREAAAEYLEGYGILQRAREIEKPGKWAALTRLTSPMLFADFGH